MYPTLPTIKQPPIRYQVVNVRTGEHLGKPYRSVLGAARRIDKLDREYGAYIHGYLRVSTNQHITR